ncbi:hypothetical protein DFH08DRAFT_390417 [Mycena albidolilacea]|uniref:Uncharacterized protein n=1 Tax=Mycena albidolilacea TaxID=1033008 RepID=A0AAD6ZFX7_9AGAR|nr:hypothetical protein DFH08DRAFT_390417 [Mycena albidolilacea]
MAKRKSRFPLLRPSLLLPGPWARSWSLIIRRLSPRRAPSSSKFNKKYESNSVYIDILVVVPSFLSVLYPHFRLNRLHLHLCEFDRRKHPQKQVRGVQRVDSLVSLRPLAKQCRELTFLAIEITALAIPADMDGGQGRASRANLELASLRVGCSPISDLSSVATFLLDIFPNMVDVYTSPSTDGVDFRRLWRLVQDSLQ